MVPAHVEQIGQHRDDALGELDGGRFFVVAKKDGSLPHGESVQLRNEQGLNVEPESRDCESGKHGLSGARGEPFQPCLRVTHVAQQQCAHQQVECAAHQVPCVQIVKERRAHEVARFRQHPAGDGHVGAGLEVCHDLSNLCRRVRQIGVGEHPELASGREHAFRDRCAFAEVALVAEDARMRLPGGEVRHGLCGRRAAAVVHDDELGAVRQRVEPRPELRQRAREPVFAIVGGHDHGEAGEGGHPRANSPVDPCRATVRPSPQVPKRPVVPRCSPLCRAPYFTLDMAPSESIVLNARALERTLSRMADEIVEKNDGTDDLVLVGIQRRGVQVAARLAAVIKEREGVEVMRGALDITLYRDDLQTVGPRPVVGRTDIPVAIEGKHIIIVDDVLFTGRTVRAALNELADFGRPARVSLAVVVDRGGRELPIQPDVVGKLIDAPKNARVDVFVTELDGRDEVILLQGSGA